MKRISPKKREIIDTIWTVVETFGFSEVEKTDSFYDDIKNEPGKYYFFEKDKMTAVNSVDTGDTAKADLIALCLEIALVCGKEEVRINAKEEKLAEVLSLFGFENITDIKGDEDITLKSFENAFATVNFCPDFCKISLDLGKFTDDDWDEKSVQQSLIFAEKNAAGFAYEVAYNLRMNGCIVEYYTGCGNIDDAVLYAKKRGIGCVLRSFPDGKLMINDFVKNEIIETTVDDFLGYYEEDEKECDCGCGHHHHHGHE